MPIDETTAAPKQIPLADVLCSLTDAIADLRSRVERIEEWIEHEDTAAREAGERSY